MVGYSRLCWVSLFIPLRSLSVHAHPTVYIGSVKRSKNKLNASLLKSEFVAICHEEAVEGEH